MVHPALQHTEHRPWPVPAGPWAMSQTWANLLFAHWRVPVSELRQLIPEPLEIDTFDGDAWLGVVPFELRVRPRFLPVVPRIAAFPEINVRTYVTLGGKPGVWFFSLDATSFIAVRAARIGFNLPYFDASMDCRESEGTIHYTSERRSTPIAADFSGRYRPTSEPFLSAPGSLESWLTERYCLYAANKKGTISRTDVHHGPWPLQHAECEMDVNTMSAPVGLALDGEPLLHFAKHIDVVNWMPSRCR